MRAQLLMHQGRFELAERELGQVLISEPSSPLAHALLAHCLNAQEKFADATREAEQAIVSDPEDPAGHYAMAAVMLERNRLPEARKSADEAIRLCPWEASHFAILGQIEAKANRWTDCLNAAEQGLEQDPDHIGCTNLRSAALTSLGRREEATQSIHSALQRNPDNPVTHANEGWRLLHIRQPEKAMQHFQESLRLDPTSEYARSGIVEAMKSRHFVYRWLFSLLLWLNRFPPRVQLMLVLGLMFGHRILISVLESFPVLKPFGPVIITGYILLVWMTWSGSALFDLVLLTSRFGRLALTKQKTFQAQLVGLSIAVTAAMCGLYLGQSGSFVSETRFLVAFLFLGLTIPLTTTFQQTGTRLRMAAAWTVILLILFTVTNVSMYRFPSQLAKAFAESLTDEEKSKARLLAADEANWGNVDLEDLLNDPESSAELLELKTRMRNRFESVEKPMSSLILYSVYAIAVSTWLGAGLAMVPQRR